MTRRARWDVAVVGLGPAGRILAHRLSARGARVIAFDADPDRIWTHTLAAWAWQLPAWLSDDVVGVHLSRPVIRAPHEVALADDYVILDNARLHRELTLDDVDVHHDLLTDHQILALKELAGVVVDARGMRPVGHQHLSAYQTAFGVKVDADVAAPILGEANAVLMDWTHFDGKPAWKAATPSFLYAMPLPDGDVLLEETHLAGRPALSVRELRRRLAVRLQRHGIGEPAWANAPVEVVRIPLERRGRQLPGLVRFGAAGGQSNPISGYSVGASVAIVDDVVAALARGERPADHPHLVGRLALEAVLRLDARDTVALFNGFSALDTPDQRAIFDPGAPWSRKVVAMGRQAGRLPRGPQAGLISATLRGVRGLVGSPTWHGDAARRSDRRRPGSTENS